MDGDDRGGGRVMTSVTEPSSALGYPLRQPRHEFIGKVGNLAATGSIINGSACGKWAGVDWSRGE